MPLESNLAASLKLPGKPPAVTVAIVFFNAMPYLPLAVASTLQQSFSDFELLLIDDGSSDGSLAFARSVCDSRVRVFSDGANLKLNLRLNEAIGRANGEIFVRMDADDVMFPNRIESQVAALLRAGRRAVIGGAAVSIDAKNNVLGFRDARKRVTSTFAARHQFVHPTVAAYTEWFRANLYSESFIFHRSQDAELWMRTWQNSNFENLEQPLLFYREGLAINVENYLGSSFGVAVLALRFGKRRPLAGIVWCFFEMMKAWLVIAFELAHAGKLLLRHRWRNLPAAEKKHYQQQIDSMVATTSDVVTGA